MNDRTDFTDGTIIDQRYRQAVQALGTINELASARHRSPSAEKAKTADLLDEAQRLFEATLYNDAWKKYRQVLACSLQTSARLLALIRSRRSLNANKWRDGRKIGFYSNWPSCSRHWSRSYGTRVGTPVSVSGEDY